MNELSFEEALKRLEEVVRVLEEQNLTLDQAVNYLEQGMKLVKTCYARLEEAEAKIEVLLEENGDIILAPWRSYKEGRC